MEGALGLPVIVGGGFVALAASRIRSLLAA
jgi:hypothetical protein